MGQDDFDSKIHSLLDKSVPLITQSELSQKLEAGADITLLDTRSQEEFEVSRIKDARFADYKGFDSKILDDKNKDDVIVVYCSVGYRSEKIGEKLRDLGFENVFNLYGGIFDWKNNGNPVINNAGLETDSVHTYNKRWSKWLTNGIKVYD